MTDEQITKLVRKWQGLFWLDDWGISVAVVAGAAFKGKNGQDYRGLADASVTTHTAKLTIAGKQSDEALLETVLHELIHVVTEELKSLAFYGTANDAMRVQAEGLNECIARQICHGLLSLIKD